MMVDDGSVPPDVPLLETAERSLCARARFLCFDVDDTITWQGALPEPAALALYAARQAGLALVAVTGRSFCWAELLLRFFRLDAAIAETGGVALVRGNDHIEVLHHEDDVAARAEAARKRAEAAAKVLREVKTARLSLDNAGRLHDTAFDLVEDGAPVSPQDAALMRAILEEEGLHVAQSSVHINAFAFGPKGPFDKATMLDRVLRTYFGASLAAAGEAVVYVGDSLNDGVLFARAGMSVAVGNASPHFGTLRARGQLPRFRVVDSGGHGFAAVVTALLAAR